MMDHEAIAEGTAAKALLNDPTLKRAVDLARARFLADFVNSQPSEVSKRETAYHMIQAIDAVVGCLEEAAMVAEVLRKQRDEEDKMNE